MPVTFGTVDRCVTTTADGFAELSLLWKTVSQTRNAARPASSARPMSQTDQSSLGTATGLTRSSTTAGPAAVPPNRLPAVAIAPRGAPGEPARAARGAPIVFA